MACKIHGPTCSGDHASDTHPVHRGQNPFNTPRAPSQTPYWLRNGMADTPEVLRFMAEHRKRLGLGAEAGTDLDLRIQVWKNKLAEERAVVDALLMDIAANKIAAPQALAHLNEWRKQHDEH